MLAFYLNPFWRMGKRGWGAVRLCRIEVGFFREESVRLRFPEGKGSSLPLQKPLDSESGLGGGEIRSSRGRNGRAGGLVVC